MTRQQKAVILQLVFDSPTGTREEVLDANLQNFGIHANEMKFIKDDLLTAFESGIKNLNKNQLNRIVNLIQEQGYNEAEIRKKLLLFEIEPGYHNEILNFLEANVLSKKEIDVQALDSSFKGVQVASRDNFNTIINQGWTGDWDLNPNNIVIKRVQIASMNDTGPYPRGCYLNADIKDIQPIDYNGKKRYRILIENPIIIDTGNRNVRFIAQPVRYIN